MIKLHKVVLIFCFAFISSELFAQELNSRLEYFSNISANLKANQSKQAIHTIFKPFVFQNDADSTENLGERDKVFSEKFKSTWFYRKLRNENFIELNSKNFRLKINPLFDLELKKDKDETEKLFTNTRGIEVFGDINDKIFFYSSFYENQSRFETYVTEYIRNYLVVPGQGAPKFLKNNKFDYSSASAYLFLNISRFLNIQLGQSKQFIGEGYRSLILSDNAFTYPFLRFNLKFKNFQYVLLWSQHQQFKNAYYDYHIRKYNSISYLSWIPASGIEFSLVESVEWPGNTPDNRKFSMNFFNPVIFWRTVQYGLNNEKNVLLGLNAKIKLYDFAQFYGQSAIDNLDSKDKSNNNFAFQMGLKHFDLFHNKLEHHKLYAQLEYNYISPYTYSYQNELMSFTHYNQPLAHPAGTGLTESLGILEYSYKDFQLRLMGSLITNSVDTVNSNFGSDVFKNNTIENGIVSHIGNKPGQGIRNEILKLNSEFIFVINPSTNLQVFARLVYRKTNNILAKNEDLIFSIGLRTNINNYYFDF